MDVQTGGGRIRRMSDTILTVQANSFVCILGVSEGLLKMVIWGILGQTWVFKCIPSVWSIFSCKIAPPPPPPNTHILVILVVYIVFVYYVEE